MSMKSLLIALFLVAVTFASVRGQEATAGAEAPTVAFCDLIKQPELYDQKIVRLQATYRYGFEWSELYCADCLEGGRVWVDFDDSFESRTNPKVAKKINGNEDRGRTVSVVAAGKFYGSGGNYGHLGRYEFRFVMSRLEKAKVILKDSPVPSALSKKDLRRLRCNPSTVKSAGKFQR